MDIIETIWGLIIFKFITDLQQTVKNLTSRLNLHCAEITHSTLVACASHYPVAPPPWFKIVATLLHIHLWESIEMILVDLLLLIISIITSCLLPTCSPFQSHVTRELDVFYTFRFIDIAHWVQHGWNPKFDLNWTTFEYLLDVLNQCIK